MNLKQSEKTKGNKEIAKGLKHLINGYVILGLDKQMNDEFNTMKKQLQILEAEYGEIKF